MFSSVTHIFNLNHALKAVGFTDSANMKTNATTAQRVNSAPNSRYLSTVKARTTTTCTVWMTQLACNQHSFSTVNSETMPTGAEKGTAGHYWHHHWRHVVPSHSYWPTYTVNSPPWSQYNRKTVLSSGPSPWYLTDGKGTAWDDHGCTSVVPHSICVHPSWHV